MIWMKHNITYDNVSYRWVYDTVPYIVLEGTIEIDEKVFGRGIKVNIHFN